MLSDIGIKAPHEMTQQELFELVDNSKDGWGHIRAKCRTVMDKFEMISWTTKIANAYLRYGGRLESVHKWLSDMTPNLVQALIGLIPQEVLEREISR